MEISLVSSFPGSAVHGPVAPVARSPQRPEISVSLVDVVDKPLSRCRFVPDRAVAGALRGADRHVTILELG